MMCSVVHVDFSIYIISQGDLLAKELIAHVENETLNPSTKKGVTDFAAVLASVQDYRQAQVRY